MSVVLEEKAGNGACIVSEANHSRSRKGIVIPEGLNLPPNCVINISATNVVSQYIGVIDDEGVDVGHANAVLISGVDATDGETRGVALVRDCEVNDGELFWKPELAEVAKEAGLVSLNEAGIILISSAPDFS